ncbi:TetR/AcrR family transcriptional regulator [Saccharopolyspora mangrovi]|uniref:TetR/AcrR family transcriptional regulator n=1 Tax=Saccharopolyspora mangrovi TaxID=3082379 RepID=A0ABU6AE92_9PSEU|nr:TetR/AcrR family transcriptional regulator [Saccharopolyspora sp. S2-29]MEB3369845.1 TetR/AcrR family transcriptional regulator [Saccharopolyspora sp. S2-29]
MAGPRGEYRKSAQRREQIVEAAFAVFAKHGYTAGSVNQIARTVGMTQTGVLHHFEGGKTALLKAVLERRDERAEQVLAGRTGLDFLTGLVEISRDQAGLRGAVQLYTILSAEATDSDHPAHGYFRDRFTRIASAVATAYEQAGRDGALREGVDPRAAALSTLAMTEGLELLWLNGQDVDMAEDIRTHINTFLAEKI